MKALFRDSGRASFPEAVGGAAILRMMMAAAVFLMGTGCMDMGLRNWRYDNVAARKLQAASVAGLPDRPINGLGFEEFFEDKVILIGQMGNPVPSGRGVPLTMDGYVLTAWHVVDKGSFQWSDTVQLRQLPERSGAFRRSDYLRENRYPGRVVWHDDVSDLAIVKFEHQPREILEPAEVPVERGTPVFSGAGGLNGGVLFASSGNFREGIGNGPFKTAGKVTGVRRKGKEAGRFIYQSTLVARGGMSGSPVVDDNGRLVGIVTRIDARLFSHPSTSFSMVAPELLEQKIREDRAVTR